MNGKPLMRVLPSQRNTCAVITALVVATMLAAPSSAGLGDTLANVRDTVACSAKAVLNPLRVVEWGMKNFERLSGKEFEREADKSMKATLEECREAAESIYARGFGGAKAALVQKDAGSVRDAADRISNWFGKDKKAPNDRRMALSVAARERNFYEEDTGVLGAEPLPPARELEAEDAPTHSMEPGAATGTDPSGESEHDIASDSWSESGSDSGRDVPTQAARHESETAREQRDSDAVGETWPPERDTLNCDDVWADCPTNTYWTEEQQKGAREVELWASQSDPQTNVEAGTLDDGRGNGADEVLDTSDDEAADAREDYERALAGLLNEDGPAAAQRYARSDHDYRAALDRMDALGEEARIEAERKEAEAAAEQERRETQRLTQANQKSGADTGSVGERMGAEGDGTCGSAPASRKYIRHGEQMQAQIEHIRPSGMTDGALMIAFHVRLVLGCMKMSLPHETSNVCKSQLQSAISEFENTYRSAIESARGSAADSSYVDEFDRNPGSSRFVRGLGISIAGTSLDNCGD